MNIFINVDNRVGSDTAGLRPWRYFKLIKDGCYQTDVTTQSALRFLLSWSNITRKTMRPISVLIGYIVDALTFKVLTNTF